jgi:hypothetical protein
MEYISFNTDHMKPKLWIIAVLNNPSRFKRRVQLFREFIARMQKYQVNICIVELAYGDRNYETDDLDVPIKVQLRTDSVLWHKENMINIGISRLPPDWEYVAWIDTDVDFVRGDWVEETLHQLQHHYIVQLFEDAIDLGPDHQIINTSKSFMYSYKNNIPRFINKKEKCYTYVSYKKSCEFFHPGYAWAARKDALQITGGLLDVAILGAGDHHMAWALIGEGQNSLPTNVSEDYKNHILNWEKRALKLHKNVNYVKGVLYHYWHGKKVNRKYTERWSIIKDNNYEPTNDIYKDWQGLLAFHEGHYKLRDGIMDYFSQRNEDSVDV